MEKDELDKLLASANEAHSKVTDFLIKLNTIYRRYYHSKPNYETTLDGKDTASVVLDSERCTEMSVNNHFDGERNDRSDSKNTK
jgi:hypothetical protein